MGNGSFACSTGTSFRKIWAIEICGFIARYRSHSINRKGLMLINYLKVAIRSMLRNKVLACINLAGLAIGLTAGILIYMWVQDELSYDRFHENAGDIYRVVETQFYRGEPFPVAVTPGALAATLKRDYPEVLNSVRMQLNGSDILRYRDNKFAEKHILWADKDFFEVFSFPLIKGDRKKALSDPTSIILTESMAQKYFHDEDPIGKSLTDNGQMSYRVTGVIKDVPTNSHLQFDCIIPFEALQTVYHNNIDNWGNNSYYTYIQLQKGYSYREFNQKIVNLLAKNNTQPIVELQLQPMTEIHLYSGNRYAADIAGHGDILYVKLCIVIAVIILLIACINYMNLATARSGNRAREIGMRKVVGARKSAIIRQFMGEALVYALIAFALSLVFVELLLPVFNNLSQKDLSLDVRGNAGFYGVMLLIALATGLVSGSYPALYLSSFRPVSVLKGGFVSGKGGAFVRKCLVVLQFGLSVVLIIGAAVVHYQIRYIHNKQLGLDKENLVYITLQREAFTRYDALKSKISELSSVAAVARTSQLPLNLMSSTGGWNWEGKDPKDNVLMHGAGVDAGYADVFRMEMAEGRFFTEGFFGDGAALVVNEEAAKIVGGGKSVIGKTLTVGGHQGPIIGVLKNFHFKPFQNKIEPLVLSQAVQGGIMVIRVNPGNIKTTLATLEESFKNIVPEVPFEYGFVDEDYDRMYRVIERMGELFNYLSALAIFVSCLGLFGLASFITEKRTKEIGVRKAYSASITDIVLLLSRQFLKWVLVANAIAWPVAYFVMKRWLQTFAYRTDIGIEIFIITSLGTFVIALITISYQTFRAARRNPVEALRYE
jgi:putative ABC transport system permease protein